MKTDKERQHLMDRLAQDPDYDSDDEPDFYDQVATMVQKQDMTNEEWEVLCHEYGIPGSCVIMLRTLWAFHQMLHDEGPDEFLRRSQTTVPCLCSAGHNQGQNMWAFACLDYFKEKCVDDATNSS